MSFESSFIFEVSCAGSKPWKGFICKGIDDFDFVIESISHKNHIFPLYEMNSYRMLKFSLYSYIIIIAICKQVSWVFISPSYIPRSLKSFHVQCSNGTTFRISNIYLYFIPTYNSKCETWRLSPLARLQIGDWIEVSFLPGSTKVKASILRVKFPYVFQVQSPDLMHTCHSDD